MNWSVTLSLLAPAGFAAAARGRSSPTDSPQAVTELKGLDESGGAARMLRHTFVTPKAPGVGCPSVISRGWLHVSVTLSPLRMARRSRTGCASRECADVTPPAMPHQASAEQTTKMNSITLMRKVP